MKIKVIVLFILFCIVLISGCMQVEEEPISKINLEYTIKGCFNKVEEITKSRSIQEKPKISIKDNKIILSHHINHNCCKNITLKQELKNNILSITEIHKGEICRCMCDSDIYARLGPFEDGDYIVNVYGIDEDYLPEPQLIFSENAKV